MRKQKYKIDENEKAVKEEADKESKIDTELKILKNKV